MMNEFYHIWTPHSWKHLHFFRLKNSEVLKALHDESAKRYHHHKTPSMKHLEEILLPESDEL